MAVRPIPEGYHSITPYLAIRGAARAVEFYVQAFSATELFRLDAPGGAIGHAEMQIGDSRFMLSDEWPDHGAVSPHALGGTPVHLLIYTADCDAMFARALAAGAKELRPIENQFYGDRSGTLEDPFGHRWTIATHVEDVSPDDMKKRMDAMA